MNRRKKAFYDFYMLDEPTIKYPLSFSSIMVFSTNLSAILIFYLLLKLNICPYRITYNKEKLLLVIRINNT